MKFNQRFWSPQIRRPGVVLAAAMVLLGSGPASAATAGEWLAESALTMARVRVVLEATYAMGGQTEKQEFSSEVYGAVVHPSGLVMLSNSHVSVARAKEIMGAYGGGGLSDPGWNVVPLSFALVGEDGSERPLVLVATDSDLDLAFLRLEQPPAEPLAAVRFAADSQVAVGDEVRLIGRLGSGFGHAPWVAWGRIGGVITSPRKAFIIDASDGSLGLPVFDRDGRAVGVLTSLFARGADVHDGAFGLAQMMSQFGGQGNDGGPVGIFLLPAGVVERLIERALEQAEVVAPQTAAVPPANSETSADSGDTEEFEDASEPRDAAEAMDPPDSGE